MNDDYDLDYQCIGPIRKILYPIIYFDKYDMILPQKFLHIHKYVGFIVTVYRSWVRAATLVARDQVPLWIGWRQANV